MKILCQVELLIFNFLISEEKGVVEIKILPLLLNMQKLWQRIPFLINSRQQVKIIAQFLFQLTYIHLPLHCISPYFSCFLTVLTNIMSDKIIGLLWMQNLERLYLAPVYNFVESIALLLQEKIQFGQLYFLQKTKIRVLEKLVQHDALMGYIPKLANCKLAVIYHTFDRTILFQQFLIQAFEVESEWGIFLPYYRFCCENLLDKWVVHYLLFCPTFLVAALDFEVMGYYAYQQILFVLVCVRLL